MASLAVPEVYGGLIPEYFTRNGLPTHGPFARAVAMGVNFLAARCMNVIPGKSVNPSEARNSSSDLRLWTTRYRASANGTLLRCTVILIPTDTTSGSPYWYLKIDGSEAADVEGETDHHHDVRVPSGGGLDLDDQFPVTAVFEVTAGAKHTVDLYTDDNCRVIGWYLEEVQRDELEIGTDTLADFRRILTMSPIYDVDVASVMATAKAVLEKQKGIVTSWNVNDPATPIAASSTTPAKLYESAGTVGSYAPTQYRNTYMDQFAATPSIPTYAWVLAEKTAGGAGDDVQFRIKGGNHAGGVDIAITGALGIYESTTFTLKPQSGGDTVYPEYLVDAGGVTGNIYAWGLIPLVGT